MRPIRVVWGTGRGPTELAAYDAALADAGVQLGFETVTITPDGSPVANYAFDVTPARYVTGLITERGVCDASVEGLLGLYPEMKS